MLHSQFCCESILVVASSKKIDSECWHHVARKKESMHVVIGGGMSFFSSCEAVLTCVSGEHVNCARFHDWSDLMRRYS